MPLKQDPTECLLFYHSLHSFIRIAIDNILTVTFNIESSLFLNWESKLNFYKHELF